MLKFCFILGTSISCLDGLCWSFEMAAGGAPPPCLGNQPDNGHHCQAAVVQLLHGTASHLWGGHAKTQHFAKKFAEPNNEGFAHTKARRTEGKGHVDESNDESNGRIPGVPPS